MKKISIYALCAGLIMAPQIFSMNLEQAKAIGDMIFEAIKTNPTVAVKKINELPNRNMLYPYQDETTKEVSVIPLLQALAQGLDLERATGLFKPLHNERSLNNGELSSVLLGSLKNQMGRSLAWGNFLYNGLLKDLVGGVLPGDLYPTMVLLAPNYQRGLVVRGNPLEDFLSALKDARDNNDDAALPNILDNYRNFLETASIPLFINGTKTDLTPYQIAWYMSALYQENHQLQVFVKNLDRLPNVKKEGINYTMPFATTLLANALKNDDRANMAKVLNVEPFKSLSKLQISDIFTPMEKATLYIAAAQSTNSNGFKDLEGYFEPSSDVISYVYMIASENVREFLRNSPIYKEDIVLLDANVAKKLSVNLMQLRAQLENLKKNSILK